MTAVDTAVTFCREENSKGDLYRSLYNCCSIETTQGTLLDSLFRHYVTDREVAGTIRGDIAGLFRYFPRLATIYQWCKFNRQDKSVPKNFLEVNCGRAGRLTTSPPSVSRLLKICASFHGSKPYGTPLPVTGIA
jgi:hypothetical protein